MSDYETTRRHHDMSDNEAARRHHDMFVEDFSFRKATINGVEYITQTVIKF